MLIKVVLQRKLKLGPLSSNIKLELIFIAALAHIESAEVVPLLLSHQVEMASSDVQAGNYIVSTVWPLKAKGCRG